MGRMVSFNDELRSPHNPNSNGYGAPYGNQSQYGDYQQEYQQNYPPKPPINLYYEKNSS
jgi:hypothetical protein